MSVRFRYQWLALLLLAATAMVQAREDGNTPIRVMKQNLYIGLFILAQFLFWIPLWYVAMTAWWAYTFLYAVNTGLNIYSHKSHRPPV